MEPSQPPPSKSDNQVEEESHADTVLEIGAQPEPSQNLSVEVSEEVPAPNSASEDTILAKLDQDTTSPGAPNAEPPVAAVSSESVAPLAPMPTTGGVSSSPSIPGVVGGGTKSKKGLVIGIIAAVLLLAGGGAGYVFGYYIPNQPENVWSAGLVRTADEMDALVDVVANEESLNKLEKNKIVASADVKSKDVTGSIKAETKIDTKNTDSVVSAEGQGSSADETFKLDAKLKTKIVDGQVLPNIYLNVTDFGALGSSLSGLKEYNGKWIAFEDDFYKEMDLSSGEETDDSNVTQADVVAVLRDVNSVMREYVFTSDKSKAVIQMTSFVATEQSEGIEANHYKARVSEENLTKACEALADRLFANQAFLKIAGISDEDKASRLQSSKDSCQPAKDDDSSTEYKDEIDVWIDKRTKLIHKVRLTEDLDAYNSKQDKLKSECLETVDLDYGVAACGFYDGRKKSGEVYYELGQVYASKDEIKFFVNTVQRSDDSNTSGRVDITVRTDTLQFTGKASYNSTGSNNPATVDINLKTEPYSGEIDSAKPEGATSIMDILYGTGGGSSTRTPASGSSELQISA